MLDALYKKMEIADVVKLTTHLSIQQQQELLVVFEKLIYFWATFVLPMHMTILVWKGGSKIQWNRSR